MTLPAVQELQEEVGQLKKFITELNSNLGTIVKTSFARNFSFISRAIFINGISYNFNNRTFCSRIRY